MVCCSPALSIKVTNIVTAERIKHPMAWMYMHILDEENTPKMTSMLMTTDQRIGMRVM